MSINDVLYENKLSKSEIIKGFRKFSDIFENSHCIKSELLAAYVNFDSARGKKSESPHSINFKVGFVVSSKKIKKAVTRNRIKRLLRETYRLNRNMILKKILNMNLNLIIMPCAGFYAISQKKIHVFEEINNDMKILLRKVFNYVNNAS